jgi:hypothetical protein
MSVATQQIREDIFSTAAAGDGLFLMPIPLRRSTGLGKQTLVPPVTPSFPRFVAEEFFHTGNQ